MKGATKRIIYVGSFVFPEQNAGAHRVLAIGKALRAIGYDVSFAGDVNPATCIAGDVSRIRDFQGFRYSDPIDPPAPDRRGRNPLWVLRAGQGLIRRVTALGAGPGSVVIAYNTACWQLGPLLRWARTKKIRVICDCTEWYSWHQFHGRWQKVFLAADSVWRMRWLHRCAAGLIVISTYLERWYSARGCRTLRLPPLIDLEEEKWRCLETGHADSHPRFVYAGTGNPDRKDLLSNFLHAMSDFLKKGGRATMTVIGPTLEATGIAMGGSSLLKGPLGKAITFTGVLPHGAVLRALVDHDFSVILRPAGRFAQAGFPSKAVEAAGSGLALFANPSSDLGLYFHDGANALMVPSTGVDSLLEGIQIANRIGAEGRVRLRQAARVTALEAFDYRRHVESLGQFLSSIEQS